MGSPDLTFGVIFDDSQRTPPKAPFPSPEPPNGQIAVFPHPLVLLFACVVLAAVLSFVLPAGQYDRRQDEATGREVVVAGTYHEVESNPVGFFDAMVSIPLGMADAASVIFLVFLIGGAFTVVDETGALRESIGWLVRKLGAVVPSYPPFPDFFTTSEK